MTPSLEPSLERYAAWVSARRAEGWKRPHPLRIQMLGDLQWRVHIELWGIFPYQPDHLIDEQGTPSNGLWHRCILRDQEFFGDGDLASLGRMLDILLRWVGDATYHPKGL